MDDTKKINILGTTNRYMIKKVSQTKEAPKKRAVSSQWGEISEFYFQKQKQLEMIKELQNSNYNSPDLEYQIMISQIEKKLNSYNQQDQKKSKNIYLKKYQKQEEVKELITINETIQKLCESELQCFYCKEDLYILYELVRELKQWTLDRIDNDKIHSCENVVISCLDCNLKRRCRNIDKFLLSKQMKIVRENFYTSETKK
jgi:hypothetical protein